MTLSRQRKSFKSRSITVILTILHSNQIIHSLSLLLTFPPERCLISNHGKVIQIFFAKQKGKIALPKSSKKFTQMMMMMMMRRAENVFLFKSPALSGPQ